MNDGPANQNQMIDITDCLEAVSVFRGWKNFFFFLLVVFLLISQAAFWLVDRGLVQAPATIETGREVIVPPAALAVSEADATATEGSRRGLLNRLTFDHLTRTMELSAGILLVTTVLYSMAMFFSLMVSLIGRLGGINHIARAFFLSLIMLVLIVPWQTVLGMHVPGLLYAPSELLAWMAAKSDALLDMVLYYLRFSGYWLIVFLLLIMSQVRSARWAKSILRRLEII